MAMFDPIYVTEVLNDILGRRGIELILTPKDKAKTPSGKRDEYGQQNESVSGAMAEDR